MLPSPKDRAVPPDDQMLTDAPLPRKPDPDRTRRDILAVARQEFAENGLSGARVDAIAARTKTTKRMIYYYFGSKEGLYLAVLEQAYGDIRSVEKTLDLRRLPPAEAIRQLFEFTFDYQDTHPDFIRLVSIENIHHAKYLEQSDSIRQLNVTTIDLLAEILSVGQADGSFRDDVTPVDVHMMISAFCFFRVSNRYTFGKLFDLDLDEPRLRQRHKRMMGDAIIRMLARS